MGNICSWLLQRDVVPAYQPMYDNPMPETTLSPQLGTMNLATGKGQKDHVIINCSYQSLDLEIDCSSCTQAFLYFCNTYRRWEDGGTRIKLFLLQIVLEYLIHRSPSGLPQSLKQDLCCRVSLYLTISIPISHNLILEKQILYSLSSRLILLLRIEQRK